MDVKNIMERQDFLNCVEEKDERLAALKKLYPEIFSDGKINLDAFMDATGTSALPEDEDKTPGYYGLYWPGKRASKQQAHKAASGTLEPVPGEGVDENTTHNIYIEGDNLEVLRILRNSYRSRVKIIYIDPPYNTGNDFIYPDDYSEPVQEYLKITGQIDDKGNKLVANTKSSGAFHRNWLNMMYPRLIISKDLLSDDGVIFISIDDNEQANLKLLCDDIFGEENFVAKFDWRKKTGANDAKDIAVVTETILLYAKNKIASLEKKIWQRDESSLNMERYKFSDEFVSQRGKFYYDTLDRGGLQYSDSMNYGIEAPDGGLIFPNGRAEFVNDGWIWKWSKEKVEWGIKNGFIEFVKSNKSKGSAYTLKYKVYQKVDNEGNVRESAGRAFMNLILDPINQIGNQEMKSIFDGKTPFSNPKPTGLLTYLLNIVKNEDSIILDFFSGSSSTADAVMQLNANDNGNRKYIMIQMPLKCEEDSDAGKLGYKTICDIGKDRIRRVAKRFKDKSIDLGFKVYRLTESNFKKYNPIKGQNRQALEDVISQLESIVDPLVEGWTPENVLEEIKLRQGFSLDCKVVEVKEVSSNKVWHLIDNILPITLYVCLDKKIDPMTVNELNIGKDDKFICLNSAIDDTTYARLSDKNRIQTL